jgi:hypothetical protein
MLPRDVNWWIRLSLLAREAVVEPLEELPTLRKLRWRRAVPSGSKIALEYQSRAVLMIDRIEARPEVRAIR